MSTSRVGKYSSGQVSHASWYSGVKFISLDADDCVTRFSNYWPEPLKSDSQLVTVEERRVTGKAF